jgi:hypothetical protein
MNIKTLLLTLIAIVGLAITCSAQTNNVPEQKVADRVARRVSHWFHYTTGPMPTPHDGQCGDYAAMFIMRFNHRVGKDEARMVVANQYIPSGTYKLGKKVDIPSFHSIKTSGFYEANNGKTYYYHPFLGAHEMILERAWTPTKHFNVNMLDKEQIHCWASVGNISVDPCWFASNRGAKKSPLGKDI